MVALHAKKLFKNEFFLCLLFLFYDVILIHFTPLSYIIVNVIFQLDKTISNVRYVYSRVTHSAKFI